MATATKRAAPPTHVSVWVGLAMAAVGLLVALYAYTGTRVYDVTFAFIAILGGIFALAGILTSAWGRAVMAARAGRARRLTMTQDTMKLAHQVHMDQPPPTVAEPPSKKRFDFRATAKRMMPERRPRDENAAPARENGGAAAKASSMFAFRTKAKTQAPPAPPTEAPAVVAAAPVERVTLKCPQCSTQFSAEGTRPFTATCPQCGFAAEI